MVFPTSEFGTRNICLDKKRKFAEEIQIKRILIGIMRKRIKSVDKNQDQDQD
jgi:hypothetical protein